MNQQSKLIGVIMTEAMRYSAIADPLQYAAYIADQLQYAAYILRSDTPSEFACEKRPERRGRPRKSLVIGED